MASHRKPAFLWELHLKTGHNLGWYAANKPPPANAEIDARDAGWQRMQGLHTVEECEALKSEWEAKGFEARCARVQIDTESAPYISRYRFDSLSITERSKYAKTHTVIDRVTIKHRILNVVEYLSMAA